MDILAYSEENLALALSNKYTSPELVKVKKHFSYFKKYLGSPELDAKTILIEENYISRDYLHDYASYYALCVCYGDVDHLIPGQTDQAIS